MKQADKTVRIDIVSTTQPNSKGSVGHIPPPPLPQKQNKNKKQKQKQKKKNTYWGKNGTMFPELMPWY